MARPQLRAARLRLSLQFRNIPAIGIAIKFFCERLKLGIKPRESPMPRGMMIVMSDRVVSITLYFSVSFRLISLDSQLCGSADRVKVDHDGLPARKIRAIGGYAGTPQGCSVKSLWRAYILVSPHARRVYSCTLLTCVPSVLRLPWLRRQSWLALSGQVSAVNEWNLCRLPLWAGIFGVARREGVARPE